MTCRHCLDDALSLLLDFGFTPEQARGLLATKTTCFLVPVGVS